MRHWRRPLKDGGVEFFFESGAMKMSGSVTPSHIADELQRLFEQDAHVALPAPEIKQRRGTPEPESKEA